MSRPRVRAWEHNGTYIAVERFHDEDTGKWSVYLRNAAGRVLRYRRHLAEDDVADVETELVELEFG